MVIILLLVFIVWLVHMEVRPKNRPLSGVSVSRTEYQAPLDDTLTCGNCRGTGQDGFGIMPDSFECDACEGKGYFKIDPNAKRMSLSEFMNSIQIEE